MKKKCTCKIGLLPCPSHGWQLVHLCDEPPEDKLRIPLERVYCANCLVTWQPPAYICPRCRTVKNVLPIGMLKGHPYQLEEV